MLRLELGFQTKKKNLCYDIQLSFWEYNNQVKTTVTINDIKIKLVVHDIFKIRMELK